MAFRNHLIKSFPADLFDLGLELGFKYLFNQLDIELLIDVALILWRCTERRDLLLAWSLRRAELYKCLGQSSCILLGLFFLILAKVRVSPEDLLGDLGHDPCVDFPLTEVLEHLSVPLWNG